LAGKTAAPRHDTTLQRALAGRVGAYVVHSKYSGQQITANARAAANARFARQVDPEGVLPEAERNRRAAMARRAHMARLSLAAAQAKAKKRRRSQATEVA
jgi:hypothetical protein